MMMCISLESLEKSTGRSSEGTKEKVRTQNGLLSALLSNNAQNLPPVLTSSDNNSHDIKISNQQPDSTRVLSPSDTPPGYSNSFSAELSPNMAGL